MEKWIEVDLDKLKFNVQSLQAYFKVPIMAVIKQNAYGLGDLEVATVLEQLGIRFFAVTNLKEGIDLRNGGVSSPILIFAPCYSEKDTLQSLWQYNLIPTVYSLETAEVLNAFAQQLGKQIDVHLKVDSGMGRMGFSPDELLASADKLKKLQYLRCKGIFTHYSNAFEHKMDYTKIQKDRFVKLVDELTEKGLTIPLKYSANSLAALKFSETHMDMVTIGSAFLGNSTVNPAVPLKKVFRCRAKVLQVRNIKKGSFIGYSNTFRAKKDLRTAVLPIGYTDGFGMQKKIDAFRATDFLREQYQLIKGFLRPGDSVFFEGKPLKVMGKTSLQLTVVDIGSLQIKPGDLVDIDLNPLLANARLARVYIGGARPSQIDPGSDSYLDEAAVTAQHEVACTLEEN